MLQTEKTKARYLSLVMSPSAPGVFVINAAANSAPKNLAITTSWSDEPMPVGITKRMNRVMLVKKMTRRPYISDRGAAMRTPQLIPRR